MTLGKEYCMYSTVYIVSHCQPSNKNIIMILTDFGESFAFLHHCPTLFFFLLFFFYFFFFFFFFFNLSFCLYAALNFLTLGWMLLRIYIVEFIALLFNDGKITKWMKEKQNNRSRLAVWVYEILIIVNACIDGIAHWRELRIAWNIVQHWVTFSCCVQTVWVSRSSYRIAWTTTLLVLRCW